MNNINKSLFQMQILLVSAKKRNDHDSIVQAFEDSVKALEQQPCEDCISRQRVLDIINFEYKWLLDAKVYDICTSIAFSAIMSKISEMPSVTPTRPTGKWIDIGDEGLVFKCSLCGNKNTIESNYCPNCGARMEEEDER